MAQLPATHPEQLAPREVFAFPQIDEFYEMLQYRLNMSVSDYIFRYPFTIFINSLPRTKTSYIDRYTHVRLIYAGIARQRALLADFNMMALSPKLDRYWDFLDHTALDSSTAVVSSQLYRQFSNGALGVEDIPKVGMGRLKQYFASILDKDHQGP
ncbi:MAG: hypothetical protein AAGJ93_05615, partial [Bacteroidota bacterium]